MTDYPNRNVLNASSPVFQLIMSLMIILLAGTALFMISIYAGSHVLKVEPDVLNKSGHVPGFRDLLFIRYSIIVQDLSFFIIPGVIILWKLNPGYKTSAFSISNIDATDIFLVLILAACAFPVTSLAGEWNAKMTLPQWLSGVEEWMKSQEKDAEDLISVILYPPSLAGMYVNIVIIAALPAISEELIFRGIFQKIAGRLFRSGHLAVWVVAMVFSAVHFQFYGFLPRLILGVIFGYLFLWSGTLWLPVLAHFINNAVPVAGAFLRYGEANNEPAKVSKGGELVLVGFALAVIIVILASFRRKFYQTTVMTADGNGTTGTSDQ